MKIRVMICGAEFAGELLTSTLAMKLSKLATRVVGGEKTQKGQVCTPSHAHKLFEICREIEHD
jgi:hypothetical protein